MANKQWMALVFLMISLPALAGGAAAGPAPDRYARRCQARAASRYIDPQGTMLWGTWSGWTEKDRVRAQDQKSVLVSASLDGLVQGPQGAKALQLDGGALSANGKGAAGAVLRGQSSDGQPVEVAICDAEPTAADPRMVWYRIEAWNPTAQEWENPCVPTGAVPNPRAVVMAGVWDEHGAHHVVADKVTFSCENGVISKCASWGYRPWANAGGHSLADAHQACTRMARADYCGNGQSHTRQGTMIEYYDALGFSPRATTATKEWDPGRAQFEAAWSPDGASCIARTRHGEPLSAILQECPGRFTQGAFDLGGGDRCSVARADLGSPSAPVLRNRINGR